MNLRMAFLRSCLFVWLRTALVDAVYFKCNLLLCTLSGLNPQHDRSFMMSYMPDNISGIFFDSLQANDVESSFLNQVALLASDVTIMNSPAVRKITISRHLNLTSIVTGKTSLSSLSVDGPNDGLTQLTIMQSLLARVPADLRHLHAIRMVDIRNSPIESLDLGIFCTTAALHTLRLIRNKIRFVVNSAKTACNLSLEELDLKENDLSVINLELLSVCHRLASLDVSQNAIELVTGSFANRALTKLNIIANRIKQLDCCQWTLPALEELKIGENMLTEVPRCIRQLKSLYSLGLSGNYLTHFDIRSLAGLNSLWNLNLSRNRLTSVRLNEPEGFLANLGWLQISDNQLTTLNLSCMPWLPSLQVFAGNNSICILDLRHTTLDASRVTLDPIACEENHADHIS